MKKYRLISKLDGTETFLTKEEVKAILSRTYGNVNNAIRDLDSGIVLSSLHSTLARYYEEE